MSLDFLDANLVLNKKRLTEQRKRNLSKKAADVSKKRHSGDSTSALVLL